MVTRYAQTIAIDDHILIWVAGKHAGIDAINEVIHPLYFVDQPPDLDYWLLPVRAMDRFYAPMRFTHKLLNAPIPKALLRCDPVLSQLQVLKTSHSTNFKVLWHEWQQLCQWISSSKYGNR